MSTNASDWLRAQRTARRLTQEQLAKLCGVTKTTLFNYENGRDPSLKFLQALAKQGFDMTGVFDACIPSPAPLDPMRVIVDQIYCSHLHRLMRDALLEEEPSEHLSCLAKAEQFQHRYQRVLAWHAQSKTNAFAPTPPASGGLPVD